MFERFTKAARKAVTAGYEVAAAAGAAEVRPDHLLVAVLRDEQSLATQVITGLGGEPKALIARMEASGRVGTGLGEDDAAALASIGIDLDEVLRAIGEDQPLPARRTRFSRAGKKVLEFALREAVALRHGYIGTEHLLLGMVRADDAAARDVIHSLGVTPRQLRTAVAEAVRKAG